jgi:uncharacterized protein (DUF58 family)
MRRVERVPFMNSFRSDLDPNHNRVSAPFSLKFRHLYNPLAILCLVTALTFVASLWSRVAWVLFLSIAIFTTYVYFDLKAKTGSLLLRRKPLIKKTFRDGDNVSLEIEVHNVSSSPFKARAIVEDHFGPARDSAVQYCADLQIAPRSRTSLSETRECDAEMGRYLVGPFRIRLRDVFGLFEFIIYEDAVVEVELLPSIREIEDLPVAGSASSPHYGLYEVASRGLSVNFSGIRPYQQGDSLRHIAWKVSGKQNELMVKEFERVVSCDITLILNLDPRLHVGLAKESTWNTAKLAALRISKQQLEIGNSIQFISDGTYIASSRGNDFFELLTKNLISLTPRTNQISHETSKSILFRYHEYVPTSSTLIYLTVFDERAFKNEEVALAYLKDRGVQIFVVLIESTSFLSSEISAFDYGGSIGSKSPKALNAFAKRLQLAGMGVEILRRGA